MSDTVHHNNQQHRMAEPTAKAAVGCNGRACCVLRLSLSAGPSVHYVNMLVSLFNTGCLRTQDVVYCMAWTLTLTCVMWCQHPFDQQLSRMRVPVVTFRPRT
eukprot:1160448-Pelagomonas_calceolata.AAC.4